MTEQTGVAPARSSVRRWVGLVTVALALAAGGVALYAQRDELSDSARELGAGHLAASLALGMVAVALTFPEWRQVLRGFDVDIPLKPATRVFFLSQLGKYLPGSVWPVIMQMEAGKAHGAGRRTMLGANLLTLVLGVTVGLLVAAALLPFSAPDALARYWWTLLVLPVLVLLLWPPVIPRLLDRVLGLLGRESLARQLPLANVFGAAGWAAVSFAAFGAHVALLAAPLTEDDSLVLPLAVGAVSLAICAGVLAIPVPAGAGIRDAALVLCLTAQLPVADAVLVAITSRAVLVVADLALAVLVLPLRSARPAVAPPT